MARSTIFDDKFTYLRGGYMRSAKVLFRGLLLAILGIFPAAAQQGNAVLFEGARLIVGDGSAPVENSAFLVENNRFTRVGKKGDVRAPAGAVRVDLGGKTVMPALVDAHTQLGWAIIKTGRIGAAASTPQHLPHHLPP